VDNFGHVPVLLGSVCDWLEPIAGGRFLDATFGGGGYAQALLDAGAAVVVGLDRDPDAVARGRRLTAAEPRLAIVEGCFGDLADLVDGPFDGIVFDLGVSSFQLDAAGRGFSFRHDGPLDMRMGADGPSAADLVATLDEAELADIFRRYGEEFKARRVARAIVERRRRAPFTRTLDLADVVRRAVGGPPGTVDQATRVFQALRIAVNDELGELERGLEGAVERLAPGGRLVVVSFHSLEDRIVKRFFQTASGTTPGVSRHQPAAAAAAAGPLELLTRKVVRPDAAECARNPRARSARLRAARRREG
jgi:16S rRNA (cytosine1402-N4)-methyltransferase